MGVRMRAVPAKSRDFGLMQREPRAARRPRQLWMAFLTGRCCSRARPRS